MSMTINLISKMDIVRLVALGVVVATWLISIVYNTLAGRKRPPQSKEVKREPASYWGIGLQTISFFMMWFFFRPVLGPIVPMPAWLEVVVDIVAAALAILSLWLSIVAIRTLGAQWTYVARVIEGHRLVTQGPYRFARNPIYLGMLVWLLASGLVWTRWWAFLLAIVLFLIGTKIRISREEKLLASTFGDEWLDYTRRVPALFPGF